MKKFQITYFGGPSAEYITLPKTIAEIKASGIDMVPLGYGYGADIIKPALTELKKQGMTATVFDPRIRDLLRQTVDEEKVDAVVKSVVEDYCDFDNIDGWELMDEPSGTDFPMLAALVRAFKKHAPGQETVINLFPDYASPEQMHCPDYHTYVQEFLDTVQPDFLSYDYYSFVGRVNRKAVKVPENESERERLIRLSAETTSDRDGFFANMEEIRRFGMQYGIDAMLIILLTEHGPYRNLTPAEILWEVNMCLAYGMRRLSYFTYWCDSTNPDEVWNFENALCDHGELTQHYYDVQKINAAIRPVGEYLFDRKSTEVFHVGKSELGTKLFEGFDGIKEIKSERPLVVGFFDDGSVYVVNADYRFETTVSVMADTRYEVMENQQFVPFAGSAVLAAGEGMLLRPVKKG